MTGVTGCRMIGACRDLTDYRRANEWIEATESYCKRQSLSGFPGVCRIHRAEVAAVGGAWDRAEQELDRATDRARRLQRDADPGRRATTRSATSAGCAATSPAPRTALREAHARGRSPQPALALVRLAEGKRKAALNGDQRGASPRRRGTAGRAPGCCPAQVEIAVAAGDLDARAHGRRRAERDRSRSTRRRRSWPAGRSPWAASCSPRATRMAAGRALRAAIKGWREVGSPYEVARARALLARACARSTTPTTPTSSCAPRSTSSSGSARGSTPRAERELRDAEERRVRPDARAPDVHVHRHRRLDDARRGARRRGVGAAAALARRHAPARDRGRGRGDRQLDRATGSSPPSTPRGRRSTARSRSSGRCATTATTPASPLAVRIGLHTAEANRRGDDYSGMGVHVAARVGGRGRGRDRRVVRCARRCRGGGDHRRPRGVRQGREPADPRRDDQLGLGPPARRRRISETRIGRRKIRTGNGMRARVGSWISSGSVSRM